MSAATWSFKIDPAKFEAFAKSLDFSSAKGGAAKAVLARAAKIDAKHNREAFKSEGASLGKIWAENKPRWAEFKKETTGKKQPLIFRGKLRDSLTKNNNPDRVKQIKDYTITLGTSVTYAKKHRKNHTAPRFRETESGRTFDSRRPWRIPGRDFLMRNKGHHDEMAREISDLIKKRAINAFKGSASRGRFVAISKADVASFLNQRTAGLGEGRGGLR